MSAYRDYMKKKRDERESSNTLSSSYSSSSNDYRSYMASKKNNFDSLADDETNLRNRLNSAYSNWTSQDELASLRTDVENMSNRLKAYKMYGGSTDTRGIDSLVSSYDKAVKDFDNLSSVYGSYQNADAYNSARDEYNWVSKNSGLTYDQVKERLNNSTDDKEKDYLSRYGVIAGYDSLEDYDKELEEKKDTKAKTIVKVKRAINDFSNLVDPTKGYTDEEKYYADLEEKRNLYKIDNYLDPYQSLEENEDFLEKSHLDYVSNKKNVKKVGKGRSVVSDENAYEDELSKMTPKEKLYANYIGNTQGEEAYRAYMEDIRIAVDKRKFESNQEKINEFADEHPIVTTGLSFATNLASEPLTLFEEAGGLITGNYNPYANAAGLNNLTSGARERIGENIANVTPNAEVLGVNAPQFAYQIATSIGDTWLGSKALGMLGKFATGTDEGYQAFAKTLSVLMGGGAFNNEYKSAVENGVSEKDALTIGLAYGINEALFEEISLDRLLSDKSLTSKFGAFLNTLAQAGVEGSEEVFTDMANMVAEQTILGNQSELAKRVDEYRKQGYSDDEVLSLIKNEVGSQLAQSFVGGAASGGLMGGIDSFGGRNSYKSNVSLGEQIRSNQRVEDFADVAESIASNNNTEEFSANGDSITGRYNELKNKFKNKEGSTTKDYLEFLKKKYSGDITKATDGELGVLYKRAAYEASKSFKEENFNDLKDFTYGMILGLGEEDANAKVIAESVTKSLLGERLDRDDKNIIKMDVAKEAIKEITNPGYDYLVGDESDAFAKALKDYTNLQKVSVRKEGSIKAVKYDKNKPNVVEITDENGETEKVKLKDLDKKSLQLIDTSLDYSEEDRKVFLEHYNGQNISSYDASFDYISSMAKADLSLSDAMVDKMSATIPGKEILDIYKQITKSESVSTEDKAEKAKEIVKRVEGKFKAGEFKSEVDRESLTNKEKKLYDLAEAFSSIGFNIKLINDATKPFNGNYDQATNTVTINLKARYARGQMFNSAYVVSSLAHEFTHWLEYNDHNDVYKFLERAVRESLGDDKFNKYVADEQKKNKLSKKDATSEVIARACEDMLNKPEDFSNLFVGADETTLAKVRKAVMDFFDSIKDIINELLGNYESENDIAKELREIDGAVDRLRNIWRKALTQAIEDNQMLEKTNGSVGLMDDDVILNSEQVSVTGNGSDSNADVMDKLDSVISIPGDIKNLSKENPKEFDKWLRKNAYDPIKNPNGKYEITYRTMQVIDGNLYPPMATIDTNGKMGSHSSLFNWEAAVRDREEEIRNLLESTKAGRAKWFKGKQEFKPEGLTSAMSKGDYKKETKLSGKVLDESFKAYKNKIDAHNKSVWDKWAFDKNALDKLMEMGYRPSYKLVKRQGDELYARYNPYLHSSNQILNDQFTGAYDRDNLKTIMCIVPHSEDGGTFFSKYAKDATGWAEWKSGLVASQILERGGDERKVFLSRWLMPVRVMDNSEVAKMYAEYVNATSAPSEVRIPANTVSPQLLTELERIIPNNINYSLTAPSAKKPNGEYKGSYLDRLNKQLEEASESEKALIESKIKHAEEMEAQKGVLNSSQVDSTGNKLTENQVDYFKDSKVRDELGNLKVVYHGTARADRVGTYFNPDRATSGPMAYFTDNKGIATNYAKDKADTSLSRDEEYDSYYTQFRMTKDGKSYSIGEMWNKLPTTKRTEIMRKASHIGFDDDYEEINYDINRKAGNGNFDQYLLREHKNNYLEALVDAWLNTGDLYNQEERFLEVLKLVGLDDVEYRNPDAREEKVYETYINITNPFDTEVAYNKEFIKGLKEWWDNTDHSKYETDNYAADMWDKTSISTEKWIEDATRDINEGTTHSWTRIPDSVTDYLKSEGYDGIFDKGGKHGGEGHTVYIPFYSNQIKDVTNENPTEDKDILLSSQIDAPNGVTKVYNNLNDMVPMSQIESRVGGIIRGEKVPYSVEGFPILTSNNTFVFVGGEYGKTVVNRIVTIEYADGNYDSTLCAYMQDSLLETEAYFKTLGVRDERVYEEYVRFVEQYFSSYGNREVYIRTFVREDVQPFREFEIGTARTDSRKRGSNVEKRDSGKTIHKRDGINADLYRNEEIKDSIIALSRMYGFGIKSGTQFYDVVKPNLVDSNGNYLTKRVQEYFEDSKARNKDGKLLVLYHGSLEDFDTFDKTKIRAVDYDAPFNGFWFSSDKNTSPAMSGANYVKTYYVNITNPAPANVWKKLDKQILGELYGDNPNPNAIRPGARSVNDELRYRLQDMGYDGVIWETTPNINWEQFEKDGRYSFESIKGQKYLIEKDEDFGGINLCYSNGEVITGYENRKDFESLWGKEVWVAFEPNQIKNTSNTQPTTNDSTFYSNQVDSDGNKLTENQASFFADSKARDEKGNLLKMYHGTESDFTTFKSNEFIKEKNGLSFIKGYFSEDKEYAERYGDKVKEYYLNITNPLILDEQAKTLDGWKKFFRSNGIKGVVFDSSVTGENGYRDTLKGATYEDGTYYSYFEILDSANYWYGDGNVTEMIAKAGYDGIQTNDEFEKAWMPFHENQIKSVDNLNPTDHPDTLMSRQEETYAAKKIREDREIREEMALRKSTIEKITNNAKELSRWIEKPDKNHRVPKDLQKPIAEVITAIDFSSKQLLGLNKWSKNSGQPTQNDISLSAAFEHLSRLLTRVDDVQQNGKNDDGLALTTYLDLPANYASELGEISSRMNDIARDIKEDNVYILNEMTSEELKDLLQKIKILRKSVTQFNNLLANVNAHSVDNVAQKTIQFVNKLGQRKINNTLSNFLAYDELLPYYAFKRFGDGAEEMFGELMDGWDKFAYNVKRITDFVKETFNGDEAFAWSNEIHEFTIKEPNPSGTGSRDRELKLTTAQIMSLYCLSKREHAMGHLLNGGIVPTDIKTKDKYVGKTKESVSQPNAVRLTKKELGKILEVLDEKQIKVADELQKFMNTVCSEWGNEITMKRFGIMGFTEENYFPIKSDSNIVGGGLHEKEKSIYALLNMSFTKPLTPGANNQIMVDDIFNVFAVHTSDMAKYNSIALPVLDVVKWWNYKESNKGRVDNATKIALETAFGKKANDYIFNFIADLNANKESFRGEDIQRSMLSKYKRAAVAANLQVAFLQPLSYVRAYNVLDKKYLDKALASASNWKDGENEANEHSGLAIWKDFGFFSTDISRGLDAIIRQQSTVLEDVADKSTKLAGKMDSKTWGIIWNACKLKVENEMNLKKGSDEYFKAINDEMRNVIYATQVIDSTMSRSNIMRSRSLLATIDSAFMSEPTIAVNVFMHSVSEYIKDTKLYGKGEAFKRNKTAMLKAITTYCIGALLESALRSAFDKVRRPDDDDKYYELIIEHFKDELNPFGKLPYFKDLVSVFQGYNAERLDEQWMSQLYNTYKSINKAMENGIEYKTVFNMLKLVSQLSGLPLASATTEIVTFWNLVFGNMFPSLRLTK